MWGEDDMNGNKCKSTCWLIALAAGCLIGLYFWVGVDWGFFWSLIAGVIVCVVSGVFLPRFFCSDEPARNNTSAATHSSAAPTPEAEPKPAIAPTADPTQEPVTASEPVPEKAPEPELAASEPVTKSSGSVIEPSTDLPGQNELANRKGSWRYQSDAPASSASQSTAEAPKAPAGVGSQPEGLNAARSGAADNLKMIKGVGPKLEGELNALGFFHFDQIAEWGAADVAWVDENLVGFKGRVSRDNWVVQAKALAAGEETEFAKRAKKDGIYD
jgi:NADH-quinone oxidoreductase subunit E